MPYDGALSQNELTRILNYAESESKPRRFSQYSNSTVSLGDRNCPRNHSTDWPRTYSSFRTRCLPPLSYWAWWQSILAVGYLGRGYRTSGSACRIWQQLQSWCFKHGSVLFVRSPFGKCGCANIQGERDTRVLSFSTGSKLFSITRHPNGCSLSFTRCSVV